MQINKELLEKYVADYNKIVEQISQLEQERLKLWGKIEFVQEQLKESVEEVESERNPTN